MRTSIRRLGPHEPSRRIGLTVIELLVAITMIAILAALILPAVQQARAAARRAGCRSHLRQIGSAFQSHESVHGRFPSNGWGYRWVGDPDRGTDDRQPGGWVYNLLHYVEQHSLRSVGSSVAFAEKREMLAEVLSTPVALFRCPSRPGRPLGLYNMTLAPFNSVWVPLVAKSDYAVNEGDFITDTRAGPLSLEHGDSGAYRWADTSDATGICFQRSRIRMQDIHDGSSNTYLVGEKYVSYPNYYTDGDLGHDQSMYTGVDLDINRWTIQAPLPDGEAATMALSRRFGSAHPGGCHFVMCDGSVRQVSYSVDAEVHRLLGNRHDGQAVSLP